MNRATTQIRRSWLPLLLSAAGTLALAGCVNAPGEPPQPSNAAFPTFAGIPQAPGDVRSVEGWNIAVQGSEAERQQLLAETAPSTFSLSNTQGFINAMRAAADIDLAPPPADQAAISAAWANAMRARATPPPRPR